MKVTLPIYHETDDSEAAKLCGKELPLKDNCKTRKVTFYFINAISPYYDLDDSKYTSIHANGTEYVCALPVKEVEKLILEGYEWKGM